MKRKDGFFLVGMAPYQEALPSFALPVFRTGTTPDLFAQEIDEISGEIRVFKRLSDVQFVSFKGYEYQVSVGCDPVFCFIEENGLQVYGSISDISPFLRTASERYFENASIYLQIIELVGSTDQKKQARLRVRKMILEVAGPASASAFYYDSVLQSALWDALAVALPDIDAKRRFLSVRSRLDAFVRDNKIFVQLEALDPIDRSKIDIKTLEEELQIAFEIVLDDNFSEAVDIVFENSHAVDRSKLIKEIRHTGRQEERVAILLAALLKDPSCMEIVFDEYSHDRGQFASWVLNQLREAAEKNSSRQIDLAVENVISDIFREVFPMNRGFLLVALAKHLGGNERAKSTIMNLLETSTSSGVQWYRGDIIERLAGDAFHNDGSQGDLFT